MSDTNKKLGDVVPVVRDKKNREVRIVVGQRGFVHIGYYHASAHEICLTHARCIRRWGTTKGLNQLVKGKTSDTILDDPSTIRLPPLAVVHTVDVDPACWEEDLKESGCPLVEDREAL